MTYYLGIDAIDGFTVPNNGLIQAVGTTNAELTAALTARGLTPAQYTTTSNTKRRTTIDETDDDVWTDDCEPGWFLVSGAVQRAKPLTPIENMQVAFVAFLAQCDAWAIGLDEQAAGQPASRVAIGHDYLWRARGGAYLLLRDTALTAAERTAWAQQAIMGAADITSVASFYLHFRGEGAANWLSWVEIDRTANPKTFTRVNLQNSITISGSIPDSVVLTRYENGYDARGNAYTGWVRGVTA